MRGTALLIFFFFPILIHAQSVKQIEKLGADAFSNGKYMEAADVYQQLMEIQPFTSEFVLNYAHSCRLSFSYDNAIKAYKEYLSLENNPSQDAYYWLADLLTIKKGCQYALKYYRKFVANNCCTPEYEKALDVLRSCDKKYKPDLVVVADLHPVSQLWPEYAPVKLNNGLVYSAYEAPVAGHVNYSKLQVSSSDIRLLKFVTAFNQAGENVSAFAFTPDSSVVYSSVCTFNADKTNCRLLLGKIVSDSVVFDSLEYVNASQPYVSKWGQDTVLFFSSDMSGGYGRMDLWKVRLENNKPSGQPENLGSQVNSVFDEITPFYDNQRNLLYYSTDRSQWGGFEIYSYSVDSSRSIRLPEPYNSTYNDMYYSYDGDSSVWVSNRKPIYIDGFQMYLNDIYTAFVDLPEVKENAMQMQKDSAQKMLDSLLPLFVYFDNDMPDPKSTDTSTYANYYMLGEQLLGKYDEYLGQNNKDSVAALFSEIGSSLQSLESLSEYLNSQLSKGLTVKLLIKAYTSTSSSADYNLKLAKRRNASLINYFLAYQQGTLSQYYGRSLYIEQLPVGETADRETSPFDVQSLKQRRVELYFVID